MFEWKHAGQGDRTRLLAIQTACANHPSIVTNLIRPDKPEMFGPRHEMLARIGAWSSGEQVLARLAIDIWFWPDEASVNIMDLVRRLDDRNFDNVMGALGIARKI